MIIRLNINCIIGILIIILNSINSIDSNWLNLGISTSNMNGLNLTFSHHAYKNQLDPIYISNLNQQIDTNKTSSLNETIHETSSNLNHLLPSQLSLIKRTPNSLQVISRGAALAIKECSRQFRKERWNCSIENNKHVFEHTLKRATSETAFVHAILSAGVTYSITQACFNGELSNCACDYHYEKYSNRKASLNQRKWFWGGCSYNLKYSIKFAKKFIDAPELNEIVDLRNEMNLHNNNAGREAIKKLMHLKCRCHGTSGSCQLKTCWKVLPKFEEIGKFLKNKYINSIQIKNLIKNDNQLNQQLDINKTDSFQLISQISKQNKNLNKFRLDSKQLKEELIYLNKSPSYCSVNKKNGISGTKGRICQTNQPKAKNHCKWLCCGRGYSRKFIRIQKRCQCEFKWCCEVVCKTCEKIIETSVCK